MVTQVAEDYDEDLFADPIKLCFAGKNHSECGLTDAASSVSKAPTENKMEVIDLTIPNIYEDGKPSPPDESCYHIKQLAVKIVDCNKFPWYYKKYIKSTSLTVDINDDDDEEEKVDDDIVTSIDNSSKAIADINEIHVQTNTLKIKYDSTIQEWKVQEGNASPNTKDVVTEKSEAIKKLNKIDFKRNKGLIGFTITQKWVKDEVVFKEKISICTPKIKVESDNDITQCDHINNHEKINNVNNEKKVEVTVKEEPVEAEIVLETNKILEPSVLDCSLETLFGKIIEKLMSDNPVNRLNSVGKKLKEAIQTDREIKDLQLNNIQQNNLRPENVTRKGLLVKDVPTNILPQNNAQLCHNASLDYLPVKDARLRDVEQTDIQRNDSKSNESIKKDVLQRNESLKHLPPKDVRIKNLSTKDELRTTVLKEIPTRNLPQKDRPLQDVTITNVPQKDKTPKDVTKKDMSLTDVSSKGKFQRDINKVKPKDVFLKDRFRDDLCKNISSKDTPKNYVLLTDKPHKDATENDAALVSSVNYTPLKVVAHTVIPEKDENKEKDINNRLDRNKKSIIHHNHNTKSSLNKNNKKDLHYFSKPNSTSDTTNQKIYKKKEQKSSDIQRSSETENKTRNYTKEEPKKGIESKTKSISQMPENSKVSNTKTKKEFSMDIKQLREVKKNVEKVAKQLLENRLENSKKSVTKPDFTPNTIDLTLRTKDNNIETVESVNIRRSSKDHIVKNNESCKINRVEGTYSNEHMKNSNINTFSSSQKNIEVNTTVPNLIVSSQPSGTEKVSESPQQGKGLIPPTSIPTQCATPSSSAQSERNTISTISSRPRIKYTSLKQALSTSSQYAKQSASIPPLMSYPPLPKSAPCAQNILHQYATQLQPSDRLFHQHPQPQSMGPPHTIQHPNLNSMPLEQLAQYNQPIYHYNYGPYSEQYQPAVRDVPPSRICGSNLSDVTQNYYYNYMHGSLVAPPPPPPPPPSLPPQTPQIIGNDNYNQYAAIIHNGNKSGDPARRVSAYSYAKRVNILTPQRKDDRTSFKGDNRVVSSGHVTENVQSTPMPNNKNVKRKVSSVAPETKETVAATKKEMFEKLNEFIVFNRNTAKNPSTDSCHKSGENPAKRLKPDGFREEIRNVRKTNGTYSPPILPIPTYENILGIVKNRPSIGTSRIGIKDDAAKCAKRKTFANDPRDCDKSKKISIDEYKKRICRGHNGDSYHSSDRSNGYTKGIAGQAPKYAAKNFNESNYNADQDLGYSSDTTVKL